MTRKTVDKEIMQAEVIGYLTKYGATRAQALCQHFQISQPSLSRILSLLKDQILVTGKAQEVKYAFCRKIENTITPIPIYEIQIDGSCRQFGILHPIEPQGFYFESKMDNTISALYPDLPYFLHDLRPTGFLGRLIPLQNEDLYLPKDIRQWTNDSCLKYLTNRGWNNIGNLILGEKAFQLYLENYSSEVFGIQREKKEEYYAQFANNVLAMGDAGSSAGGEQPKFSTILLPEKKHVLVKFSPPTNTELGIRIADILYCEHIALQTLNKNSQRAAKSQIYNIENRVFLEVERFDRLPNFGRLGLISLASLDGEYTGVLSSWGAVAAALAKKKIISKNFLEKIYWQELFGELIANNDMHLYNFSFVTQGQKIVDIAPIYDMCPMLFMPRSYQLLEHKFSPPTPKPEHGKIWGSVCAAASEFWSSVLNHAAISSSFKIIAKQCLQKVIQLEKLKKMLPS